MKKRYRIHGDNKGYTIAILETPKKPIIRKNYATLGTSLDLKLFGVEFDSWHAEIRIVLFLLENPYYLNLIKSEGLFSLFVYRYTWKGNHATSSKPCPKCRKVLKIFKKKFLPNCKFVIKYIENHTLKTIEF